MDVVTGHWLAPGTSWLRRAQDRILTHSMGPEMADGALPKPFFSF